MLKQDILRTYDMAPGGRMKKAIACFRSPGVHAIIALRFGQWLLSANIIIRILLEPVYSLYWHRVRSKWGIEIDRCATIGHGFYIGHFGGIVISGGCVLGNNINISQGVTIGVSGQGDKIGCPIIGNDVYIAPGAKIFGKIKIGNNVKIGANAVIYKDIPDNAIVVLDPGFKIISMKGNRQLNDINISDTSKEHTSQRH
jgi:serine O-acetyltransferase